MWFAFLRIATLRGTDAVRMLKLVIGIAWATACSLSFAAAQQGCEPEIGCTISGENGGTYHVAFPADWDGKSQLVPFFFFHGHNGSGASVIANRSLVNTVTGKGYALIAPDGPEFTFSNRTTRGWAARREPGAPRGGRDDIAFVERVLDDLKTRWSMKTQLSVMSGFSSGGSMAWYFGCYSSRPVGAIAALAGGLRRPLPEGVQSQRGVCPGGPRRLIHIHGFADRQVPLEGRAIRSWHQGDVFEGLAVQRRTNGCVSRPSQMKIEGRLWCRSWIGCKSDNAVRLCLHPGGHGTPKGWFSLVHDWVQQQEPYEPIQ